MKNRKIYNVSIQNENVIDDFTSQQGFYAIKNLEKNIICLKKTIFHLEKALQEIADDMLSLYESKNKTLNNKQYDDFE